MRMRLPFPTYLINTNAHPQTQENLLKEFKNRNEFSITVVEPATQEMNSHWESLVTIITTAQKNKEEFIIVCNDTHQFTTDYSIETFCNHITQAKQLDAEILLGGVHWFDTVLPITDHILWINYFS